MASRNQGIKKSNFPASATIPAGSTFDFVSGGVNYKITIENLVSGLGVTGTIVQDGAVTGTPILDTQGTVNNIRNIEDGPGVKASVSPENGVTLEHNFTTDTSGVELVVDLAATQPKFRSLIAGPGINVSSSNGSIQISSSAIPASTKTVIVNQMSDFPAAVGGVIVLDSDTEYAIQNDLTTSNRFIVGNNTVLSGSDSIVVGITYTGSGIMFTSSNASWKIKDLTINCASGTLLSFSGTGASEIFQIIDAEITAATLGAIGGFRGIHFDDTQITATAGGFTFSGANGVMLLEAMLATINAGTLFDLGVATFGSMSVTDSFVTLNGSSVFLDGAAASANINAGGLGSVHNCRFFGTGTALQTITNKDARWQFFINDDISDTHYDALMSLTGNLTPTTIAAVLTPTKIAGTWVVEHESYFTSDTTGKTTYNGAKELHVDVTMSFSAEPVSGTNKKIGFYVAKNGTEISASEATSNVSAGDPKRITVVWRLALQAGDYIEAFVENETDAIDILVSDAVIRVS